MHFEPHAVLGWALGNIARADRRLRNYCVLGAVLPDIDALSILAGGEAYGRLHHTFGHNVFAWALFTAWVTLHCRSRKAFGLSFLTFGLHLLADAKLSAWKVYLFWPWSDAGYILPRSIDLGAPINTQLVYLSFLAVAVLALFYRRTPIDIVLPKLDQLLVSCFTRKTLQCHICQKPANQTCSKCGKPACPRHGAVQRDLSLACTACVENNRRSITIRN